MKKVGLLLWAMGWALGAAGQTAPAPAAWQAIFFEAPALALPLLEAVAVRHSAELEAFKTEQAIAQEDLQIARKAILGSVLFSSNIGYGNIASVTVADQTLPSAGTKSSQTHYSTAINLNLPLDRLLSRRNQIARQQLQGQKVEYLRQARENVLRLQVIDLYQSVLLTHKVLALRQQSYATAQMCYQLGEKQFKDGEILLSEVSQMNDRYINAAIEQENAGSKYTTAFMLLESVTGSKISDLMTGAQALTPQK